MLIDAHQHVGYLHHSAEAVISEMDQLGIDQAWLLTWELPPAEDDRGYHVGTDPRYLRGDGTHAAMPLAGVLEARDRYPDRFIAGYCPCPTIGDPASLFEAAYHMHGVRICGEWSCRTRLDDPRSIALLRKAGDLGCPVVLHMDVPELPDGEGGKRSMPQWYAGPIEALENALAACPQTIIIGHAPGFWRYISGDADRSPEGRPPGPVTPGGKLLSMFDRFPNLYADLSAGSGLNALSRDAQHARAFLIQYAGRLLFGRDQYGQDLHQFLQTLELPNDVWQKIAYQNAQRLVPAQSPEVIA